MEIRLQYYNKNIFILMASILILASINLYPNVNLIRQYDIMFQNQVHNLSGDGINPMDFINKEAKVTEITRENGWVVSEIDNPVRYSYDMLMRSIKVVAPEYFAQFSLEIITYILGPVFFGIFGAWMTQYDYREKTVKIRAVEHDWKLVVLSKQLTIVMFVALTILLVFSVFRLCGPIIHDFAMKNVSGEIDFNLIDQIPVKTGIIQKILISICLCSLFGLIGSFLAILFRSTVYATVMLVVYNFFVPNLGAYDIKNVFLVIGHHTFDFYGNFRPIIPHDLMLGVANFYVIALLLLVVGGSVVLSEMRSKYV
ncbi:MAG: hypothetical protein C6W59_04540 [Paenibacillaceae bacterium]|nr:MAG: hypothetical protein C6W59_04540 [Paenibacillaceae bacterium]